MFVTVFRSRLNAQAEEQYREWAVRLSALVTAVPGYVSHKGFMADDGERVTIVEFASQDALRAWATHPEHVQAKKLGRSDFFDEYRVQVCSVVRDSGSRRPAGDGPCSDAGAHTPAPQ